MTTTPLPDTVPQRSVLIVQRRLTHYRVRLFEQLHDYLLPHGVKLLLSTGEPSPSEKLKNDSATLSWAIPLTTRYWLGERVCWQPFARAVGAMRPELVIMPQENRLLYNLIALFVQRPKRVAFWGHGANLQSSRPDGLRERFKRWTSRRVDWWFGYTEVSRQQVEKIGFPPERITILNNAIDTADLHRQLAGISDAELRAFAQRFRLSPGRTGLYIGSLYPDKRIDLLLEAATLIRAAVPDFSLLIAGDGPERGWLQTEIASRPWIHWLGLSMGRDKALALRSCSLILNPGMVGLSILDAFACGAPLVTTASVGHSPEIAYLKPGHNGLLAPADARGYAAEVISLLARPERLARMAAAAHDSASEFSLEAMVERFGQGILQCLETAPLKRGSHTQSTQSPAPSTRRHA